MEEHGVAYFEFENGSKGIVDGGKPIDGWTLTLVGTEGVIRVKDESRVIVENAQGRTEEDFSKHPQQGGVWDRLLEELIDWIEGGPAPRVGHPSMLKSAELNLSAYLSALKGDRIDLPWSAELEAYDEWPVEAIARRNKK